MKNRIISLVSNNIATDQRLIKIGTTLQNSGYDFKLIGTKHRGSPSLEHIPFKTRRLPILFQRNFLFYAELQIRIFFQLLRENKKESILLANDLDTLLPAFLISKIFRIPLVFDSHEIFSELPSLKENSIQKKVWKLLEKWLLPKLKFMYTVSHAYANFFKTQYGIQPKIIKNVPFLNSETETPNSELRTPNSSLIYQGAINPSRGIDKMILAMQYLEDVQLNIVGDGPCLNEYKTLAHQLQLGEKVKFLGRIKPEKLKHITPKMDLGLSLEEDNGLSYRYALPNKMFDYIHAGIPVLGSSDLVEVKELIQKYQIGDVIQNHEPDHIAKKIAELLKLGKYHFSKNVEIAAKDLNWQNQEAELLSIFEEASREK